MRLLYYSITAPIGGHLRSAATIGKEMIARGNEVHFVTAKGPGLSVIEKSNIPYTVLPNTPLPGANFNWSNFLPLYRIIKNYKPDVVHSFLSGLPQLALITRMLNVKFVSTICGGQPHKSYPKMNPITVFSNELKYWLVSTGVSESWVYVIPGRMKLIPPERDRQVGAFLRKIGVPEGAGPVVMMVCRTDQRKSEALHKFFDAAKLFATANNSGVFVHIGSGNEDDFEEAIRNKARAINQESNRTVLISTDKGSDDPIRYLQLADYVVGMARSAFEGMSFGKPTLILSNEGYGGVVEPNNIEKIADYNFTGRFAEKSTGEDHALLFNDLIRLISDASIATRAGEYAREWYKKNLDVRQAADEYENIYRIPLSGYRNISRFEICRFAARERIRALWRYRSSP